MPSLAAGVRRKICTCRRTRSECPTYIIKNIEKTDYAFSDVICFTERDIKV